MKAKEQTKDERMRECRKNMKMCKLHIVDHLERRVNRTMGMKSKEIDCITLELFGKGQLIKREIRTH